MSTVIDHVYHRFAVEVVTGSHRGLVGYYAAPVTFTDINEDQQFQIAEEESHWPEGFVFLHYNWEDSNRILALRLFLDEWDRSVSSFRGMEFNLESKNYLVLADSEADQKWEENLHRDIYTMIIPDAIRPYVDEARWITDMKVGSRGQSVATFDGREIVIEVDAMTYFIYRLT